MLRKTIAAIAVFLVAYLFAGPAAAGQGGGGNDHDTKVWVCKYTTTPGEDEVLKNGNDGLVWVSQNAIKVDGKEKGDVAVGDTFADKHEKSLVIQVGGERPSITECPGYEQPEQPDDKTGVKETRTTVVCVEPLNGTATRTTYGKEWTITFEWDSAKGKWVEGDKEYGSEKVLKTETVDADKCAPPPPTDVCTNWPGVQTSVPDGWYNNGKNCYYIAEVCWLMDHYEGDNPQLVIDQKSTFPQTRVDCEDPVPCGMWVQKDYYKIDTVAKEELLLSLGDTLEWVNNQPEDKGIYAAHEFVYGGDCEPPPYCLIGETKYYEGDQLPEGYTWTAEGNCIPPQSWVEDGKDKRHDQVCVEPFNGTAIKTIYATPWTITHTWNETTMQFDAGPKVFGEEYVVKTFPVEDAECIPPSIDTSVVQPVCDSDVPWIEIDVNLVDPAGNSTDDGTVDLKFSKPGQADYWMYDVVLDGDLKAMVLWPGASVVPDGEGGYTATGWPGWAFEDGAWVPVGDSNFGWTRDGASLTVYFNPETTVELEYPPATWECLEPPPVQVCEYTHGDETGHMVEYPADQVPNGSIPWVDGSECGPDAPTVSVQLTPICLNDYPWINYQATLNDPDGQVDPEAASKVTFTFLNAANPAQNWSIERPLSGGLGSGGFYWPGADANLDGVADGWPGWQQVDGEWLPFSGNFNWTRGGVNILASVNPDVLFTGIMYPSATDPCAPTELNEELDAPPADPVEGEAQFAG